jgi:hypothetical protein
VRLLKWVKLTSDRALSSTVFLPAQCVFPVFTYKLLYLFLNISEFLD